MKKTKDKRPKKIKIEIPKDVEYLGHITYTKENQFASFELGVNHLRLHIA